MGITRQINHIHYSVLLFWFALGGLLTSVIFLYNLDSNSAFSAWDAHTCLLQSFLGIFGSILATKAVCWVSPARSMVIRSIQIVISYIIQVWAFDTVPHWMDLVGAIFIAVATLATFLEDWVMAADLWRLL